MTVSPVTVFGITLNSAADLSDAVRQQVPAAVEILESPASPLGRVVALSISLFAVIATLWACVGEIDIVAVAQGKIVPVGRTKTMQAPRSIRVRANDGISIQKS
jgi:hemolysin D